MSLPFNPQTIQSGFNSVDVLNENFDNIETALADGLSRSGSTPNAMGADLDMNSNRILNLPTPVNGTEPATYAQLLNLATSGGLTLTGFAKETQTATAGQTVFTLSLMTYIPGTNTLLAWINGVNQASFTETSSTVVTFSEGLQAGDEVMFLALSTATTASSVDSSIVTYNRGGSAVNTNVKAILQQTPTAADFGIVADGSTDDSAAFLAYANYCAANQYKMILPKGSIRLVSSIPITLQDNTQPSSREGGFSIEGQGMYATTLLYEGTGYCLDYVTNSTGNDDINHTGFSIKTTTGGGIQVGEGGNLLFDRFFMDGCASGKWGLYLDNGSGTGPYQVSIVNCRFWNAGADYLGGAWYINDGHTLYSHNTFVSKMAKNGTIIYMGNVKNIHIPTITLESRADTYTAQVGIELDGNPESTYIGTVHGETRCNTLIKLSSAAASRGLKIGSIFAWQKRTDSGAKDFVVIDATSAAYKVQVGHIYFKSDCTYAATAPGYLVLDDGDMVEIQDYVVDQATTHVNQYGRALKANPYHTENSSSVAVGTTTTPGTTFDLGRAGSYLVSVTVQSNDNNHSRSEIHKVIFDDSSNDYTSTEIIGTTATKGSGVGNITLTVDKDGVVTVATASSTSRSYNIHYGWRKLASLPWS